MNAAATAHDGAFSCPRCSAAATSQPGVQTCGACKGTFTLHAGVAGGAPLALPAPDASWRKIQVKAPGVLLMRYGALEPAGIAEGNLDPVIGAIPVDTAGVAYGDVISIAVWRSIAWLDVAVAVLIPLPLAALLFALAVEAPAALFGAVPFAMIAAFLLHRALLIRACRPRIAGRYRTLVVRFDRPSWRRLPFHAEMFRRYGIETPPLP